MNRELRKRDRETGSLMAEVMMAVAVLAIGALAFLSAFFSNQRAVRAVQEYDEAHLALENVSEQLRSEPLETVYKDFDGRSVDVPALVDPTGQTARVQITCFVNESAIPPEFGPLPDIDGNPKAQDADCSTTYEVLPTLLRITWAAADGPMTAEAYIVLGEE